MFQENIIMTYQRDLCIYGEVLKAFFIVMGDLGASGRQQMPHTTHFILSIRTQGSDFGLSFNGNWETVFDWGNKECRSAALEADL